MITRTGCTRVPGLIRAGAAGRVSVGLKLFNALDDDAFQLAMLRRGPRARAGPIS